MPVDFDLAALALARCVPLALLMPLGARDIPRAVALSLWLALSALLYAFSEPLGPELAERALILRLVCELGIGALFAAALALPFVALQWSGQLAHASLLWRAPAEHGPLATLFRLSALNLFFMLGGHRALCVALISSLEDVPLGLGRFGAEPFLASLSQLAVDLLALSLALSLPLLITLWLVDLCMSLIARASGYGVVTLTRSPVRAAFALVVVALTLTPAIDAFPSAVRAGMSNARSLIRTLTR